MKRSMSGVDYVERSTILHGIYKENGGKLAISSFMSKIVGNVGFGVVANKAKKNIPSTVRSAKVERLEAMEQAYKKAEINDALADIGRRADLTVKNSATPAPKAIVKAEKLTMESLMTAFGTDTEKFLAESINLDSVRGFLVNEIQKQYRSTGDLKKYGQDILLLDISLKPFERAALGI